MGSQMCDVIHGNPKDNIIKPWICDEDGEDIGTEAFSVDRTKL